MFLRQEGPTYEQQLREGFLPVWQGELRRVLGDGKKTSKNILSIYRWFVSNNSVSDGK